MNLLAVPSCDVHGRSTDEQLAEVQPNEWCVWTAPAGTVHILCDTCGCHKGLKSVQGDRLPRHVRVMPAQTPVSTYSLFQVMDACLTVRGTIGIEAASFGIPVVTAGTGRYDHKGFTVDSESREEYLGRLARLHELPPLSAYERELAERFAYGVWVLRPWPVTSFTCEYERDAQATIKTEIRARTKSDWLTAPDLRVLATWLNDRRQLDLLMPDEVSRGGPEDSCDGDAGVVAPAARNDGTWRVSLTSTKDVA